jgi:hypothetical protein
LTAAWLAINTSFAIRKPRERRNDSRRHSDQPRAMVEAPDGLAIDSDRKVTIRVEMTVAQHECEDDPSMIEPPLPQEGK